MYKPGGDLNFCTFVAFKLTNSLKVAPDTY